MAKRVTKLKAAAEAAPQTREEVSRDIRTGRYSARGAAAGNGDE